MKRADLELLSEAVSLICHWFLHLAVYDLYLETFQSDWFLGLILWRLWFGKWGWCQRSGCWLQYFARSGNHRCRWDIMREWPPLPVEIEDRGCTQEMLQRYGWVNLATHSFQGVGKNQSWHQAFKREAERTGMSSLKLWYLMVVDRDEKLHFG